MAVGQQDPISPRSSATLESPLTGSARRNLRVMALALSVVVTGLAMLAFGYQLVHSDRVYAGVTVLDVAVGSMSRSEAQAALDKRFDALHSAALNLTYGDKQFSLRLAELGVRFDSEASVRQAMSIGREGGLLDQLGDRLEALRNGAVLTPVFELDDQALDTFVRSVADAVDTPVKEATLVVGPSGAEVALSAVGVKVNVDRTILSIRDALAGGLPGNVDVVVEDVQPSITESDLREAKAAAEKIVSAPIVLTHGSQTWVMDRPELAAMVRVVPADRANPARLTASLDESALRARLAAIAAEIDHQPRNAQVTLEDDQFVVVPSQEGARVNLSACAADIVQASIGANRTVPLSVEALPAAIQAHQLTETAAVANKMVSAPIVLKLDDRSWTLWPARLREMVTFAEMPERGRVEPQLDQAKLSDFLSDVAVQVNVRPRNARVQLKDGAISVVAEGQDGITLKVEETAAAIASQARTDHRTVELKVQVEKPKLAAGQAGSIVLKDLLVSASTSYAGSIAERAHNVRLATSRLNGVLIAPGDEFSFNDELGPVTLGSGYKIGYGIVITGGQMQTVPSEGGGICQVATTVFHAAFWAGLDITQRYAHLYWMPRYGQPPLGMTGLDATVDQAYGVDLRFKNNTGNWLALMSHADSSNIHFSIYGVNPGWEVKAQGPFISNVVKADHTMVRQEDPTLPPGRELLVEHAEDGFDCLVVREVLKDGAVIDRRDFRSHYMPARNVTLVGPSPTPTPGPSPTPDPSTTPMPSGDPATTPGPTPTPTPTAH